MLKPRALLNQPTFFDLLSVSLGETDFAYFNLTQTTDEHNHANTRELKTFEIICISTTEGQIWIFHGIFSHCHWTFRSSSSSLDIILIVYNVLSLSYMQCCHRPSISRETFQKNDFKLLRFFHEKRKRIVFSVDLTYWRLGILSRVFFIYWGHI